MSKVRWLTVEPIYKSRPRRTYSLLRLKGLWLKLAGFEPGSQVQVIVESGKIIILNLEKS